MIKLIKHSFSIFQDCSLLLGKLQKYSLTLHYVTMNTCFWVFLQKYVVTKHVYFYQTVNFTSKPEHQIARAETFQVDHKTARVT